MNNIKSLSKYNLSSISISNHALERAKQRIDINHLDKNSLEYIFKIKELLRTANYVYSENGCDIFYMYINNKRYEVRAKLYYNNANIITIIRKD